MTNITNITTTASLVSLPGRNVLLTVYLINDNSQDYYFYEHEFMSEYSSFYINNTQLTRKGGVSTEYCGAGLSCPTVGRSFKIPAFGAFTGKVNILHACSFLLTEPLGYEHYVIYGAHDLFLRSSPDPDSLTVSKTTFSRIELPFRLIDGDDSSTYESTSRVRCSESDAAATRARVDAELEALELSLFGQVSIEEQGAAK